jgi:hypothetical protein
VQSQASDRIHALRTKELQHVSTAKHELQAQLERIAAIETIAIEVKAIGYDEDNDETSSNDDPDAEMQLLISP